MGVVQQMPHQQVVHTVCTLPLAQGRQDAGAEQHPPELLGHAGPDDEVDRAGFILQGHEHHAFGRARTLAVRHQATGAGDTAVGIGVQNTRWLHFPRAQTLAQEG
jgi:hypothetical protein